MIRHLLHEVWNALSHYRLRTILTLCSIVWGVTSLVLLLAYGNGFGAAMMAAFDQIGKDLIVIFPGQTSLQAGGERAGRRIQLELRDVEALKEGVPAIEAISPEVRRWLPVAYGPRTKNYSIAGVHAAFGRIRNAEVEDGRFLCDDDVRYQRRVAVIGATLKKELYNERPAVGSIVKIKGVGFTVIGVLRKKTQITNYSTPDDMTAFVPLTTLSTMVDARYLNNIVVMPASNQFRDRFIEALRSSLARAHRFSPRDERAVTIMDWNQFRSIVTALSTGLNLLLMIIGSLTLSIGAVGVMNIMLVSVNERTREIGVLRAIGAKRSHVLIQILLEGLALTTTGGVAGILLALVLSQAMGSLPLLSALEQDPSGRADIRLSVSGLVVLIAVCVLMLVGLAAALVPAMRAARLKPVEAIRGD
jgi:putative ABC transport system permease protein